MAENYFNQNIQTTQQHIRVLQQATNRNAAYRLLAIVGGGIGIWQLFALNNVLIVLLAILLLIVLFAWLVYRQSKMDKSLREAQIFLQINENELNISQRGINLYGDGERFDQASHPYSSDLDIFGPHSLFAYVNRCASKEAEDLLADWFKQPSSYQEIVERQQAVEEIAADAEHLQAFQTKMHFNLGSKLSMSQYLQGMFAGQFSFFSHAIFRYYVPIAPWIFLVGLLCSLFVYPLYPYLIALALVHYFWTLSQGAKVNQVSSRASKIGASLIAYGQGVELIEKHSYQSPLNLRLQQQVLQKERNQSISTTIQRLGLLIDKLDIRNNLLVGAVLNMLFLWDFKQVRRINAWKAAHADWVTQGLKAVAEYEALVSLGLLRFNHPNWALPEVQSAGVAEILAEDMHHPLIAQDKSVGNDYRADAKQVALITGSNMAGKSTFLRTFGINAVLAYAGGVVPAQRFCLPIFHILSYMRIKDSLNESTSTFKAELNRLKFILDQVAADKQSYFLIDEMLRGTNSVDKYLGSKAVIEKLIASSGRGMVATHDLKLSEMVENYPETIKNYHFDIQVQNGEMLFDYKLKQGPCRVFNASLLLQGIGIYTQDSNSQ